MAALTSNSALTLPLQIAELTTELADECFKGDVACQVLESERAERLRASREVQELKASGRELWGCECPRRVAGRLGPALLCSYLGCTGSLTPMLGILEDIRVFLSLGLGGVLGEDCGGGGGDRGQSWFESTLGEMATVLGPV